MLVKMTVDDFIGQLFGIEALWGLYIIEVPAGGALNVERHLYEKTVLVVANAIRQLKTEYRLEIEDISS